jgi:plastocyanin
MLNQTKNTIIITNLLVISLSLLSIYLPSSFGQTASEIDITTGAGSSANAACVAAEHCFTPNPFNVAPGATVTWKNTDTVTHALCSGKPTDVKCGPVFEDDSLKPGETFQFTFPNSGVYDYYCSIHPWMTGQVIVGSASMTGPTQLSSTGPNSTNAVSGNTGTISGGNTGGITVTTDKASYKDGDTVRISGTVSNYVSNTPVTIRIIDPIGEIVKVDQTDVGFDRTFSTSITATGALWQNGVQTVKVQYGSPDIVAQTAFQFSGSGSQSGNTIKVDGTDLSVKYSITNGKVLGIRANIQSKSLVSSIQTTGNGVLTVTLPRVLINPTLPNGQDDRYHVLVDNQEENNFQETSTTTTDRTLSIPFTDGTAEITIMAISNSSTNPTSANTASTITVTTDKASYSNGNTITISGTVNGYISIPVTIRVNDPSGNIIELTQTNVESDRTFSTIITDTTGVTWQQVGTYSVIAIYGNPNIVAQTTFQFLGSGSQPGSLTPASAITVTTDKALYDHDSQIIITGHVANSYPGQTVGMKVTSPSGNVVSGQSQISLDNNGGFTNKVSTVGNLWFENGQYTVAVQSQNNQAMINSSVFFQLAGAGPVIGSPTLTIPPPPLYYTTASDGTIVEIRTAYFTSGQPLVLGIKFTHGYDDFVKHQNYAITVMQDNRVILSVPNGHTHTGVDVQTTSPLLSTNQISIQLTLNGVGLPTADPSTWTGVKGEVLSFAQSGQTASPSFGDYKTISGVGKDVDNGMITYDVHYFSVKDIVSSSVSIKDKSVNFVLTGNTDTNSTLILKLPPGLISGPFIGVFEDGQIITNYIISDEDGYAKI